MIPLYALAEQDKGIQKVVYTRNGMQTYNHITYGIVMCNRRCKHYKETTCFDYLNHLVDLRLLLAQFNFVVLKMF